MTTYGGSSVRVSLDRRDGMPWMTPVMVAGLALALLLAVIGGLPFDIPMPFHRWGVVDPTCGLTRGSTAIARGDLATAWHYNPMSFVVMGLGLLAVGRAVVGAVRGRWLNISLRPTRWTWLVAVVAVGVLWAYQQTNADFVINARI